MALLFSTLLLPLFMTDNLTMGAATTETKTNLRLSNNNNNINRDRNLIIRGHAAEKGRFPYMASLTSGNLLQCGGTLVAPDIILTANHCMDRVGAVELGRYNISNSNNHDPEQDVFDFERHVFQEVVRHPRYLQQADTDVDEFDFALIKIFDRTRLAAKQVKPIRLNGNASVPDVPNQELLVMGWGKANMNSWEPRSDVLRVAEVHYVPNDVCRGITSEQDGVSLDKHVFDITLCAGDFEERDDSCTGDSGGPIVIPSSDNTDNDTQVGVTSYGFGCGHTVLPGIYSRISYVYDWIEEHVCRLSLEPPSYFHCPVRNDNNEESSSLVQQPSDLSEDINDDLVELVVQVTLQDGSEDEAGWILQSHYEKSTIPITYAYMPIGSLVVGIVDDENENDAITSTTTTTYTTIIQVPNNRQYNFTLFDSYGNGGSSATIIQSSTGQELLSSTTTSDWFFQYSISSDVVVGDLPPTTSPTVAPPPSTSSSETTTTVRPDDDDDVLAVASLYVTFDDYPEETGWYMEVLVNETTQEYETLQQVFPGTYTGLTSVMENIVLPVTSSSTNDNNDNEQQQQQRGSSSATSQPTFRFTMTDNERDGICCTVGRGSYELWINNVTLVVQGGEFVWEESTVFQVDDNGGNGVTTTSSSSSSSQWKGSLGIATAVAIAILLLASL